MPDEQNSLNILENILHMAKTNGADTADAVMLKSVSLEFGVRLGKTEKLERAESHDLGLRVFVGNKQAVVSSTDYTFDALTEMVQRCVAMAKIAPDDACCGIADIDDLATESPDLDINDPIEPNTASLRDIALEAEDAARAVAGVSNSEGADANWSQSQIALATTNGFSSSYSVSNHSYSISVVAGEGTAMERDYNFATAVHANDLPSPSGIGKTAGLRAVKRLNPKKKKTKQMPVIFDPRVSGGLIQHLLAAINGNAIARGTSFLKEEINQKIFPQCVSVVEDPLRKRGLRSKPFDGEGLPTGRKVLVEKGKLNTWIMDLSSARKLGLSSTGNASRGVGAPPLPAATNVWMEPGSKSPHDLIENITEGFYITELIGMGVNGVTGDYSRGASGFWIENGEVTCPVSEMTIAGNLKTMFSNMTPASDLNFRLGVDAPSIRVDAMTVAGA